MPYKDREKRREYQREYHRKHQRYWKEHYKTHKESYRVNSHRYYEEHKEEDRERKRAYAKQWRQAIKREVLTHYSNGKLACVKCGIADIDVLCIDHIKNGGTRWRLSGVKGSWRIYTWLKQNGYPEGYQTLCANCNLKKRIKAGVRIIGGK